MRWVIEAAVWGSDLGGTAEALRAAGARDVSLHHSDDRGLVVVSIEAASYERASYAASYLLKTAKLRTDDLVIRSTAASSDR